MSTDWSDVRFIEDGFHQWYDDKTRFRYHTYYPLKAGKEYSAYLENPITGLIVQDRAGNQLVPGDRIRTFPSWWLDCIRITVDQTLVPEELTDFPVYVDLSQMIFTDPIFFSQIDPAGSDIVVVDGSRTVKMPRELAYLDTGNDKGELWFRAHNLHPDKENVFYILYNSFVADVNDPAVWSNGYRGVYHLNAGYEDSTVHARHAAGVDPMSVPALISDGREFDGIDDAIEIPFPDTIGSRGTVSLWVRPVDWVDDATILDATTPPNQFFLDVVAQTLRFRLTDSALNQYEVFKDVSGLPGGIWQHLSVSWRYKKSLTEILVTPAAQLYFDGDLAGKSGDVKALKPPFDSLFVGHTRVDFETHWKFDGTIDEIHISDVQRTPGWIRAQYNNQKAPWEGGFFKEITAE